MQARERAPGEGGDSNDIRERSSEHLGRNKYEKGRGLDGVVVGREGGVKDKEGEHQKRGPSQKEGRNSTVEGQGKKKAGRKGVENLVSGRSWSRLNGNLRPFVLWELEPPPAWIHLVLKKRAKGRGRR